MAPLYLAMFLIVFCGFLQQTDGACNVSCTTDYISTLNCSCSGLEKKLPSEIYANCSDDLGFTDGRCVIRPPQLWCIIQPDSFYLIANPDTVCKLEVKQLNRETSREEYKCSKVVLLSQMIKPQQPANLTLTKHYKELNLSWEMAYKEDENVDLNGYLMYRVRLRPKDITDKAFKMYNVREDRRHQEIQCDLVSPGKIYIVDVQASVNHQMLNLESETEWSEWSASEEFTCPSPEDTQPYIPVWYFLIPPLVFGLLGFFGMCCRGRFKKLCLFQYIPDPHDFFKPLYHTYQGDFKKWVGPVFTFSSFEVLEKSAPLQVLGEKQQATTLLQRPLFRDQGSGGSSLGDWSFPSLMNPDFSKRYFLGGSSLGLAHSGGHISIDTVTVSGQEGAVSDFQDAIRNTIESPCEAANPEPDSGDSSDGQGLDDWQLQANDRQNGEGLSLDSFGSNENSDYGYPQLGLDLDTIDSGFLESDCSSPVSCECEGGEQIDTALLGSTMGTHSNYVKQWVAFIPSSEENSNSL